MKRKTWVREDEWTKGEELNFEKFNLEPDQTHDQQEFEKRFGILNKNNVGRFLKDY